MKRTAVVLFAGDPRREEAQKGLPARFLARLHDRLTRTIRAFDVDLLVADDLAGDAPSLSGKVEQAFVRAFARGYERVIVLAGDIVLPPSILKQAIDSAGTLIGRTRDGGFYLLACDELPFIDWTSLAYDDVAAQLAGHVQLPQLRDVDSIEDARAVAPSLIPHFVSRRESGLCFANSTRHTQLRAPPAS